MRLALGLRCIYAVDRPLEQLEADLAGVPDLPAEVARGVRLAVLGDLYRAGSVIDPDEMLATFTAATEDAVAQGYAGLRVVADATPLIRTPEQLAAFATWEHKADRYMGQTWSPPVRINSTDPDCRRRGQRAGPRIPRSQVRRRGRTAPTGPERGAPADALAALPGAKPAQTAAGAAVSLTRPRGVRRLAALRHQHRHRRWIGGDTWEC